MSNSLHRLLYSWLRRNCVQKRRLSGGLCLAFAPSLCLLTISRLGALNEFGGAVGAPSVTECDVVLVALEEALRAAGGWVYGDIELTVEKSSLLKKKSSTDGYYWFLYRFSWGNKGEKL